MNDITVGSLRINEVRTTTGKKMLAAFRENGTRLLMDVTSSAIEDGQNGYVFDNKLIISVHWANFTDEDIKQTVKSAIKIRFTPSDAGFWTTIKFGTYAWGDVITLPGLMNSFNDTMMPITDVVLLISDSSNGRLIAVKNAPLDNDLGIFLRSRNKISYDYFNNSGFKRLSYRLTSELIADWETATAAVTHKMLSVDASSLATSVGTVGVDIGEDNTVRTVRY